MGKRDGKSSKKTHENPINNFSNASEVEDIIYPKGIQEKFKKLFIANKDIIGIISIDKTNIEQPVVQGKDNKYYYNHDFYNNKSPEGTAFLDINSKPDLSCQNTVIYVGNNTLEASNFSQILEYKKADAFKQAPVVSFDTLQANYRWKIYASFLTTVNKKDDNGNVFDYANQDLIASDFESYVKQIDMRKFYTTGVDLLPTDKLLTISVPSVDFNTGDREVKTRFVIVARKLRYGESEDVDFSRIKIIENPYKPQAYYDNIGEQKNSK